MFNNSKFRDQKGFRVLYEKKITLHRRKLSHCVNGEL